MLLFELFEKILIEGGNVEIGGIGAERIDLTKISRSEITKKIDLALRTINIEFKKQSGIDLWSPDLISSREFLSGSAFHFLNPSIPDVQFVKHKPSVGDIDTMVDKKLKSELISFLNSSVNRTFGAAKLIGYKPNPGGDTLISLWEFNEPPIRIQIDLELVDYSEGKPTEWSKFSHSSDWGDLSSGVKGVFHKYLLRALTHKDSSERYVQMKTKLKKVVAADLAFAVTGGLRRKYEPVIDTETGKISTVDGIPVYKELSTKDSVYITDVKEMFKLLIGKDPADGEDKKLSSFVGTLDLIKKNFPKPIRKKIAEAFVLLLFGQSAQQLYRGDPESDRKEKEIALTKMLKVFGVTLDNVESMKNDFYAKYKNLLENYSLPPSLPIHNPKNVDPALLTTPEYLKIVDPKEKRHPSEAYDMSLEEMNYRPDMIKDYPVLINNLTVRGLKFQLRANSRKNTYNRWDDEAQDYVRGPDTIPDDEIVASGKPLHDVEVGLFNDKGQMVGTFQDEWGTVLIAVAREYRGFGFGQLLGRVARTLTPTKTSGGFTPAGRSNFIKVHREIIRDALASGKYRELVKKGKISIERVKEILDSAHLKDRPNIKKNINLDTSDTSNWVVYGEYGAFVVYDKKLPELHEEHPEWEETAIKGYALVEILNHLGESGILVKFGGDSPKIKQFLLMLCASYCSNNNADFAIDPVDIDLVDESKYNIGKTSMKTGYKRTHVKIKTPLDIDLITELERRFRKKFDKYDEFKNTMIELAESKYSTQKLDENTYKRKSIKHIYNPGSTTEMSDSSFLDMVELIHKNGDNLDGIPINLKIDGAGIRFGKDKEGKPFFMTSKVTRPLYKKDVGAFEHYNKEHNGDAASIARAQAYDHALQEILSSKFINRLSNDTIVQAEMLFNEMAEHSPEGLKFVNIAYDPKTLGSKMTIVPFNFRKFSTGEHLPNSDLLKKTLLSDSNKEIKIVDNQLKHEGIDLSSIITPIVKDISMLRTAISSKKKDNSAKIKAKEILQHAKKAMSDIILEHPKLGGKDQLGANIEGIVINLPNGELVKVTSSHMKTKMSTVRTKTAVVTVGSFAGHKGHQQLIDLTFKKAREVNGDAFVYVGSKVGIDDPFPPSVKLKTLKKLYPEHASRFSVISGPDGSLGSPIKKIEKELVLPAKSPYKKIIIMVGDDRYDSFKKQTEILEKRMKDPAALAKFGGTQDQVDFQVIRTPRAPEDGGTGMSFTYLRNILKDSSLPDNEKLKIWAKGFDENKLGEDYIKYLMGVAKKGMGI